MKWWSSVEGVGVAVWCPSLSIGKGSNPNIPSSCALVECKGYDRLQRTSTDRLAGVAAVRAGVLLDVERARACNRLGQPQFLESFFFLKSSAPARSTQYNRVPAATLSSSFFAYPSSRIGSAHTASPAQNVRLVVAFTERRGTLSYSMG